MSRVEDVRIRGDYIGGHPDIPTPNSFGQIRISRWNIQYRRGLWGLPFRYRDYVEVPMTQVTRVAREEVGNRSGWRNVVVGSDWDLIVQLEREHVSHQIRFRPRGANPGAKAAELEAAIKRFMADVPNAHPR